MKLVDRLNVIAKAYIMPAVCGTSNLFLWTFNTISVFEDLSYASFPHKCSNFITQHRNTDRLKKTEGDLGYTSWERGFLGGMEGRDKGKGKKDADAIFCLVNISLTHLYR